MKKASVSFLVLFFAAVLVSSQSFAQGRPGNGNGRPDRDEDRPDRPDRPGRPGQQPQPIPQPQPMPQPIPQPQPYPQPQPMPQPYPQPMPRPDQGHHGPGRPGPHQPRERQVVANALISLRVGEMIRGQGQIDLMRLVRQQTGMTLEGAEIQRVVVDGQSMSRFGRAASVSVLLNGRLEGRENEIDPRRGRAPIPLNSFEPVEYSLSVLVRGDARIDTVHVRVGRVRPLRIR